MLAVRAALHRAALREDLAESEANAAMLEILRGDSTPALTAGLLTALRMKGETVDEVTGFVRAMRANAVTVRPAKIPPEQLVDTCGTGGDGGATFNVSTAAAFVVAGAGLAVAKHGNRSISSRCGSADVLEQLGVNVDLAAEHVARSIDETGIGFLFAQRMHPAMKHAGPVRRELGMRTVFNMLGPLSNPAGASIQMTGVYEDRIVLLSAQVLANLGTRRALVVHGSDGMDEITTTGPTRFAEVRDGTVHEGSLSPRDFGLELADPDGLAGGDAPTNAKILQSVLTGQSGPARDVVVMNSGAALCIAGLADGWREGASLAAESIDSGAAARKLASLVEFSREYTA